MIRQHNIRRGVVVAARWPDREGLLPEAWERLVAATVHLVCREAAPGLVLQLAGLDLAEPGGTAGSFPSVSFGAFGCLN